MVSECSLLARPLFAASVCKIRWQGCLFPAVLFSRHRRSLLTGQSGTEQWWTIKNRFWLLLTSGLLHSFVQTDCKKPPPLSKNKALHDNAAFPQRLCSFNTGWLHFHDKSDFFNRASVGSMLSFTWLHWLLTSSAPLTRLVLVPLLSCNKLFSCVMVSVLPQCPIAPFPSSRWVLLF